MRSSFFYFFYEIYFRKYACWRSIPQGKQLDVQAESDINSEEERRTVYAESELDRKAVVLVLLPTNSGEDPNINEENEGS